MEKVDFDNYADNYDEIMNNQLSSFEDDVSYFAEYKIIETKKRLETLPNKILDFGCGVGRNINFIEKHFENAKLFGCDISSKSIQQARREIKNATFFELGNDLISEKFDLIFISNVFHHIAVNERQNVIKDQIIPLLNDNGNLIVFEHNPFNPVTRYLVATCPFDKDAVLLYKRELKRLLKKNNLNFIGDAFTLFFPSVFKRLRPLEKYLKYIPLGGQYYVHFKK
jgi:SAM-dependent methyltransferase